MAQHGRLLTALSRHGVNLISATLRAECDDTRRRALVRARATRDVINYNEIYLAYCIINNVLYN